MKKQTVQEAEAVIKMEQEKAFQKEKDDFNAYVQAMNARGYTLVPVHSFIGGQVQQGIQIVKM